MKDAAAKDIGTDPASRRTVYLTHADDIAPVLKVLRDHAADVELRIAGVETGYTGRILDLSNGQFLLEDIRPRDGIKHLRRGTGFSFSARVEDMYVSGENCRVARVESERGLPYFRADLPERLLRQRRRRHTRITLPPRVSPNDGVLTIERGAERPDLDGQIIDVSVGGCRAVFKGAVMPALQIDEPLSMCHIRITASIAVDASGTVRHSAWDANLRTTTCGIEFAEMSIPDRRRLEHYVSQLSGRPSAARA